MRLTFAAAALTTAALVAAVLLAFGLHRRSLDHAASQFQEHQLTLARHLAAEAESYLAARSEGLRATAALDSVRQRTPERMLRDLGTYRARLTRLHVLAVSLFDEAGIIRYSTSPGAIGRSCPECPFLGWAKDEANREAVSLSTPRAPEAAPGAGGDARPAFHPLLVTPVYEPSGAGRPERFAGVLSLSFDLQALLSEQVARLEPDVRRSDVWAVEQDGTLLFHSDHPEMVHRSIWLQSKACGSCHVSFDYVEEIIARRRGTVTYSLQDGALKMAAFAPVEFGGARWIVVVKAPYEQVTAFARKSLRQTLLLLGVIVTTLGAAVALFSRGRRLAEDITERRRAEDAILKEKAFSEAMLASLPGFFCLFDHAGRLLRWNHRLETVSRYSAEEIAAMKVPDFFAKEDRALIEKRMAEVFAAGAADAEAALLSKDGARTPHYFSGVRIDVDGALCCLGTGFDITTRKNLEAQLRQSHKLEAIGQLAGGVAHDFNNILGVIIGYGELAQRQLVPGHPVRARVDEMLKAGQRAAGLTRQLLAFSRKQVLQPRRLDLNAIVADTHRMLGRLIGEDVEVVVHPAPDLGTVNADPGQIEQIILNLAVNARDAMPKGGRLTLETANVDLDDAYCAAHPSATPGRFVMLAVSDTGIGMDQETQQRIFEPFFTTKPEGQGTGLGLATVYGIVKQSGGYIWVCSEPGSGTTFKMYVPRVDEPAETRGLAGLPAEAPRGQETILLVEDTETLGKVIRETLEERGYTVLLASNGGEALTLAREHEGPIHLLLTDVVMPKLGGMELAKLLLALRPEIRVLYMSGYTSGAISEHGVLAEGVMLLEKPFTWDKLARAVREALDPPAQRG